MKLRWMASLGLMAALIFTAGCGDSDGVSTNLGNLVEGTWELTRQSTDGGDSFDDVNNNFRFTFDRTRQTDNNFSSGTWSDTDGNNGTYQLNGDRLTVFEEGEDNINSRIRIDNNDRRLRLTFYTNDSFNETTDRVSIYDRISFN